MISARSTEWAIDVARRLLSDRYKINFRSYTMAVRLKPNPLGLLVSEVLVNGSSAGNKSSIYAVVDVSVEDGKGVGVVSLRSTAIMPIVSARLTSNLEPTKAIAPVHYSKWGVLGGFVHVPQASSVMEKELARIAGADHTQATVPVTLRAGQFIACSFVERAAFSPGGSSQTGYFGPNSAVGLQLRCAEPVAAFTDDVYSLQSDNVYGLLRTAERIDGASSQGLFQLPGYSWATILDSTSVGGVQFNFFECQQSFLRSCMWSNRNFEMIHDPAELIRRTGEKKGSDMSRNGGTRSTDVVGQYVHYNECLLPADPRLGKHRVVGCERKGGRVFITPCSPWMKTVLT